MKDKANIVGILYFFIHLITEIVCFFALSKVTGNSAILWLVPFIYDALAFVPQSLIGLLSDNFPDMNTALIGILLLTFGFIAMSLDFLYLGLITLCFGNCFIHVSGAEITLRLSSGKLFPAALFVSGGSFGVVAGKILAQTNISFWYIVLLGLLMLPLVFISEKYKKYYKEKDYCQKYDYYNNKLPIELGIILIILIVAVRGYMGYGIPTSWNKTTIQLILLYVTMGIGKAMGGFLSDKIGMKKTAYISIIGSLPFLFFGDHIMILSLIGIMLFSMTMAITLGLLVSILKENPGVAFGLTTIGLFLGTVPIFFIKISSTIINIVMISILSIICLIISSKVIRGDQKT